MLDRQLTCLLTIHGIGFQQAPDEKAGTPGYADRLHEGLRAQLPDGRLGDDPHRARGPVYVQSHWPPESRSIEPGLARLGRWVAPDAQLVGNIDISQAPLVGDAGEVAHVALVYSHLEDQGPHPGAAVQAGLVTALWLPRYSTAGGVLEMAFSDFKAAVQHPPDAATGGSSLGLAVRSPQSSSATVPSAPSGLLGVLRALETDVAAYICRNDLRERVRSFVFEALLRVCCRPDVGRVVLNTHSNGTVITFDVLQRLPQFVAGKVRWFVTAGSPLRKYVEMDFWGTQVGCMDAMGPPKGWTNFWDEHDPVADPLVPGVHWRRGMPLPGSPPAGAPGESLFETIDEQTGRSSIFPIQDVPVDNVTNSIGGGLRAHNYWDNGDQVVKPLAGIVEQIVAASG
ncbi:MAG: hypothetical protein NVS4B8_25830 [Herpetosiphon sp.]